MDISTLSTIELKALLEKLPSEIKRREKDEKAKALAAIEALAAEYGFKLDDLMTQEKQKTETKKVAAKYRHPTNQDLSWSGRGRQPRWIADFIEKGGTLEQLAL